MNRSTAARAWRWTASDIPSQEGRTVLVTGATSGLGLETARALAGAGAHVVLAARDPQKTARTIDEIRRGQPDARLEALHLDLADLASVRHAAEVFAGVHDRLDVLVNNAGVMATPLLRTADGFELQIGTNHLGHFALTGLLLPSLRRAGQARVVNISSIMHWPGRIRLHDLNWQAGYDRNAAYSQSKLANLLHIRELQRRCDEARIDAIAVAAHPGWAATHLQTRGPEMVGGWRGQLMAGAMRGLNLVFAQDAAMGALPQLYAATAPNIQPAGFYGPSFAELRGHPTPSPSSRGSKDPQMARELWQLSEQLTGVVYQLRPPTPARGVDEVTPR
jgi:NAD(P)-dependent dehydrogenase (short-subunit alcohol dehydrogenase family)